MPDLTPEQEQERLRLIQQQNEAANELLSTYERLSTSVEQLKNDEKELVSLSKQLVESSVKTEKSLEKRSETLTSIVNLSKSLNKETLDYNKSLTESVKLKNKLSASTAVKPVVKTPTLPETTTQTVTPNINVEVPELTVTPKLKLGDIPELIVTPKLKVETPEVTITPVIKIGKIPEITADITPNVTVTTPTLGPISPTLDVITPTLAPLEPKLDVITPEATVTPKITVITPTLSPIKPELSVETPPALVVTPNFALGSIPQLTVTPNLVLGATPQLTVIPNLAVVPAPIQSVVPNLAVEAAPLQTVTPNIVVSPVPAQTVTPNLIVTPVPTQSVVPNLAVEAAPQLTVIPNLVLADIPQQTVTPNIQVLQAPLQTITPNLAVEATPQLTVTPNLVLADTPPQIVTPNIQVLQAPLQTVIPNLAVEAAPLQTVTPNIQVLPAPQQTITPDVVLGATPQLLVTPNLALADIQPQVVTPNIQLLPTPVQTVTPNLVLAATPQLTVTPNIIVTEPKQQTVTPNLVLASPLAPLTITPNLVLGSVSQLTVTPDLAIESTPLSVTPNFIVTDAPAQTVTPNLVLADPLAPLTVTPNIQILPTEPQTVVPNIQVLQAPLQTIIPNLAVDAAPQLTVTPNLVLGPVPQLSVVPNFTAGPAPQLLVNPNLALADAPVQTVVPNLVLGPIPQLTVAPNLVLDASPQLTVTPNFVVAPAPQQTVIPNLTVAPVPQLTVTPNIALADVPVQTVTPNLTLGPSSPLAVIPNFIVGPTPPLLVNPNLALADAPVQTVVPNLILGLTPQLTVTPNLAVEAAPQLTVTPNLVVADAPAQIVIPNFILGPIPQLTVTPNLVAEATPLVVTPNITVTDAPQQTVTPNLILGPVPQLQVIPNLSLGITPQLMVTPSLALEPSPVQTVVPNLMLGPIPQLTITPNLSIEAAPQLTVTPNLVLAEIPQLVVTPNFVLGSISQLTITPDLALNAVPQLIVTPNLALAPTPQQIIVPNLVVAPVPQLLINPNLALADAPIQTVTPNLVLGPIPQLTVTPNLVVEATSSLVVTPNITVTNAPQQTVTPNLILGPVPQLTVTPNLALSAIPQLVVTPNIAAAEAPVQTVVPNLQLAPTPLQTVTPNLAVDAVSQLLVTPNLILGPVPQLTVVPNFVAEVSPINVTPNFVATEAPQLTVAPNFILGPVPQINITPNLAVNAAPQLTVTPNIAVAEAPSQTVVPNLVLGPIPQLTITPNLAVNANPISVTPNFVVAETPQQTVTPNLVVADPLAPLSVTPNLQLVPQSEPLFVTPRLLQKPILDPLFVTPNFKLVPPTEPIEVTPSFQLATLSPLTVTPEIQVQTPVLTVTPEVNVVNPSVTAEVGGTAGPAASSFPFDKKQLTDIFKDGISHALKKYERSPSLGVTLDKDKSGLLVKLASAATNIFSEIKKKLGGTTPEIKPSTPAESITVGGNTGVGVMNTGTTSAVSQVKEPETPTASGLPTGAPLSNNLSQLITASSDEAKDLQEQIIRINEKIKAAGGAGENLQKAFTAAGEDTDKLNALLGQANRNLSSITDNAEYIYRTFQDISDELTRQNTLLKLGKSAFGAYTDIAQNLNSYQKGYNELTDKQFKKYKQSIEAQKSELKYIVEKLGKTQQQRLATIAVLSAQSDLSKSQKARLKELENEEALLNNAGMALESGIPVLERELNLTKQISDTRSSLGGITRAAGEVISKFGGSLAKYLNISDATEAVAEYNKNLVKSALENEGVQNKLLQIEEERVKKEQELYEEVKKIKNLNLSAADEALQIKKLEKQYTKDILDLDEKSNSVKQNAIKSVDTLGNKFRSLGVFAKEAGAGLLKSFSDPVVMLTTLIELGFKADNQVTQLGKSLNVSKDVASGMRDNMASFARSTGDTFINTDRLLKAQTELSEQLGIAVQFSNEELASFAKLTELTGLSAQEAGKLAGNAAAAGVGIDSYTSSIREGAFAAMQATKTHFSTKEIMQDISKLSAGITSKFQGNPKALAAAVVEAKKLGTNLETIDKIGDSLLNWESSIENELKAELMTGKSLNLERARAAALSGDQLTLTREISDQVGTLNDFQHMNVLAQKSLAEAFGMSREEMADMLMKQEAINKYGDKAAELNSEQLKDMERQGLSADEYLKKQEQQRAAQDKFKDAMTKLQDLIGNLVAGPVGSLLDALSNMVGVAMKILSVFSPIFDFVAWIARGVSNILSKWYILYPLIGIVALSYLPKMVAGFSSMGSSIMGVLSGAKSGFKGLMGSIGTLKDGLVNAFSGGGIKGFFSTVKEGFTGAKSQFAGGSLSKGKELLAKKQSADKGKNIAESATEKAETTGKVGEGAEKGGSDGSKFKTKMQNIAEGIKAFGNGKVILGGLIGLPASAVGLIAMIPGYLGIKLLETVNGDKFQSAMEGVANGISAFGKNATIGAIAKLALGGIALDLFALGVPGLLLLQLVNGTLIEKTLGGIGKGIAAFSQNVSYGDLIKGAVAIALLGASLIPAAYAFKQFSDVKWEDMAKAGVALIGLGVAGTILGGMAPELILGAIAIAALGASLIPSAIAFKMFADVNWESLAKAGVALIGLGVAGALFGSLMPLMLMGAVAIAALGASLIPFAFALNLMVPALPAFSQLLTSIQSIDVSKLLAIGPALIGIGVGLAALGGGGVLAAIGSFLGGDPIKKIERLAKAGDGLMKTSSALQGVASALTQLSTSLATLDISKLEKIAEMSSGGGITGFLNNMFDKITNIIGINETPAPSPVSSPTVTTTPIVTPTSTTTASTSSTIQPAIDLTPMIAAINDVKTAIDRLNAKDTNIYLDGDKVSSKVGSNKITGTNQSKGTYKVA
jgi:hypothetical protein